MSIHLPRALLRHSLTQKILWKSLCTIGRSSQWTFSDEFLVKIPTMTTFHALLFKMSLFLNSEVVCVSRMLWKIVEMKVVCLSRMLWIVVEMKVVCFSRMLWIVVEMNVVCFSKVHWEICVYFLLILSRWKLLTKLAENFTKCRERKVYCWHRFISS